MKNATTNTTAVVPFQFNNSQMRGVTINDEPWIVAKDVCDILGLDNITEALRGLDEDEKGSFRITEGTSPAGGNPNHTIINESGLYALIFRSRKPEAKAFRKWVTAEVLPALRKTGQYRMPAPEQPGRPGPEWITAKEAAAQWNMCDRSARRHLARMAKNGAAEVVNPANPKTPKYYRQSGGRELQWQDVKANNGIRFIGHVDDKGRITLTEIADDECVLRPKDLPRLLADPAFRMCADPEEQRRTLAEISTVATLRANYNASVARSLVFGDERERGYAARCIARSANA